MTFVLGFPPPNFDLVEILYNIYSGGRRPPAVLFFRLLFIKLTNDQVARRSTRDTLVVEGCKQPV